MSPLVLMAMDWARSQIIAPAETVPDQTRTDAALIHRLLSGADGPALMELLARTTVLRPALNPALSGEASHDYAQRRTGENNVFNTFVHLFDTHAKLQRTQHDRHPDRTDRADRPVFGWWDAPGPDGTDHPDPGEPDAGGFDPGGNVAFRG